MLLKRGTENIQVECKDLCTDTVSFPSSFYYVACACLSHTDEVAFDVLYFGRVSFTNVIRCQNQVTLGPFMLQIALKIYAALLSLMEK